MYGTIGAAMMTGITPASAPESGTPFTGAARPSPARPSCSWPRSAAGSPSRAQASWTGTMSFPTMAGTPLFLLPLKRSSQQRSLPDISGHCSGRTSSSATSPAMCARARTANGSRCGACTAVPPGSCWLPLPSTRMTSARPSAIGNPMSARGYALTRWTERARLTAT